MTELDAATGTPLGLLALAAVGVVSGVVNTLAGAGTLITLPALIFFGLPATEANATGRVGVALQSAAATATFRRQEVLDLRLGLRLLGPAAAGAVLGAWASSVVDPAIFQRVVAVAMLLVLGSLFWSGPTATATPAARRWRVPIFFAIGVYGGFLQAGVGLFLIAALRAVEGMDLVSGNALKSFLVLGFTLVALAVFGVHGLVNFRVALALAAGSALGGWLGSHLSLRGGAPLIKGALTVVVLVSSSRLLGLW